MLSWSDDNTVLLNIWRTVRDYECELRVWERVAYRWDDIHINAWSHCGIGINAIQRKEPLVDPINSPSNVWHLKLRVSAGRCLKQLPAFIGLPVRVCLRRLHTSAHVLKSGFPNRTQTIVFITHYHRPQDSGFQDSKQTIFFIINYCLVSLS